MKEFSADSKVEVIRIDKSVSVHDWSILDGICTFYIFTFYWNCNATLWSIVQMHKCPPVMANDRVIFLVSWIGRWYNCTFFHDMHDVSITQCIDKWNEFCIYIAYYLKCNLSLWPSIFCWLPHTHRYPLTNRANLYSIKCQTIKSANENSAAVIIQMKSHRNGGKLVFDFIEHFNQSFFCLCATGNGHFIRIYVHTYHPTASSNCQSAYAEIIIIKWSFQWITQIGVKLQFQRISNVAASPTDTADIYLLFFLFVCIIYLFQLVSRTYRSHHVITIIIIIIEHGKCQSKFIILIAYWFCPSH